MSEQPPHQINLRKARISTCEYPYFLTTCTSDKMPVLTLDQRIPEVIIDSLCWLSNNQKIRLLGFVIMPDHLHLSCLIIQGNELASIMHSLKSFTSKKINLILSRTGNIWEKQYYDHTLRDEEDFIKRLQYMHNNNPIRKGFVDMAEDYPWSTANARYKDLIQWQYIS